jgi:hypothetical protein
VAELRCRLTFRFVFVVVTRCLNCGHCRDISSNLLFVACRKTEMVAVQEHVDHPRFPAPCSPMPCELLVNTCLREEWDCRWSERHRAKASTSVNHVVNDLGPELPLFMAMVTWPLGRAHHSDSWSPHFLGRLNSVRKCKVSSDDGTTFE